MITTVLEGTGCVLISIKESTLTPLCEDTHDKRLSDKSSISISQLSNYLSIKSKYEILYMK